MVENPEKKESTDSSKKISKGNPTNSELIDSLKEEKKDKECAKRRIEEWRIVDLVRELWEFEWLDAEIANKLIDVGELSLAEQFIEEFKRLEVDLDADKIESLRRFRDFQDWKKKLGFCKDSVYNKDEDAAVVLKDYTYYPWGWCGMEYGVEIHVKRWTFTHHIRIPYRDAYNPAMDNRSLNFDKIDSVWVDWSKIEVTVKNESNIKTYIFYLPEEKKKDTLLSKEEQKAFSEKIKSEKERLLKLETKNGVMPRWYDFTVRKTITPQWAYLTDEIPYKKAEIVDEFTDLTKWIYIVVIIAQIAGDAYSWIQYKWTKYKITPQDTIEVWFDLAYQDELEGGKKINMKADL